MHEKEAFGLFFIVCYLLDSALRQTQHQEDHATRNH
jgi:hypothetical protein